MTRTSGRGGAPTRRQGLPLDVSSRWGVIVREALSAKGISANQAAGRLRVSPATLSSWLNGVTEPPLRMMAPIGEITGITQELLSQLAGYLPESHRAASYQLQAAREMQDSLARIQRWVGAWQAEVGLDAASAVAGRLLQFRSDWSAHLYPDVRGERFPTRHATYIAIAPKPTSALARVDNATFIAEVEQAAGELLALTGTTWRGKQRVVGWPGAPRNILTTPYLERGRAPSTFAVCPSAPWTVPVIGVTYAHAETVGALLAHAWGYGYQNAAFATMEQFGLARADDPDRFAQASLVRNWINAPAPSLAQSVWSFADYRTVLQILGDLKYMQVPFVVCVLAGPRILREAGATMWQCDPDELLEAQAKLEESLNELPRETVVVTVTLDDNDVQTATGEISDALIWDAAVEAAWQAMAAITPSAVVDEPPSWFRGPLKEFSARLTERQARK